MNLKEYLYEYDFLECALAENLDMEKYMNSAFVEYTTDTRNIKHKAYFEAGTDIVVLEAEAKDGLLTKIGKQVEKLIESIKTFLSKILDKINPRRKAAETQEAKLKDIMRKDPAFGKKAIEGLASGNLSVKDYDQLIKTADSIMRMYEADQLTEEQYNDKIGTAIDKFNKSGKSISTTIATATGIVAAIASICNSIDNMSKTQTYFKTMSEKFNDRYETLSTQSPSKAKNIFRSLLGIDRLGKQEFGIRYSILNRVTAIATKLTGSNSVTDKLDDTTKNLKAKGEETTTAAKDKYMSKGEVDTEGNPITDKTAARRELQKTRAVNKLKEEAEIKRAAAEPKGNK